MPDKFARDDLVGRVNERVLGRSAADSPIDDLERFVFGVAKHVLQEHWRQAKRRMTREVTLSRTAENLYRSVTATVDATGVHSRATMLKALRECLEQLPETERLIAERCYADGKSKENRAALAVELGIARNTLDARLSRMRARLEGCVKARLRARNRS